MESLELMPARVRIAAILKKAIYAGEYKSGEELSLTEIAEQLGVSRTPVREAFQSLAAEGLITLRMNRGAIVNKIDRKFIRDAFEMRILLESEAAARAASAGMEVDGLLERLSRIQGSLDTLPREDYQTLNQDIHIAIWNAAGNQKLKQVLLELWNGPSVRASQPEETRHYQKSTAEHIEILTCIGQGKPEGARAAMARHIARSMENILQYYPEEAPEKN